MTDRHLHCVYFKYDNHKDLGGWCLLKQKKIKNGFSNHCENLVLRPSEVLTYYLMNKTDCDSWAEAGHRADKFLDKIGFNDYPKGDKK